MIAEGEVAAKPRHSQRRRVLFAALAPIVGIFLAELLVRACGLTVASLPESKSNLFESVEQRELLFVNRPYGRKRLRFREAGGERELLIDLNSQRFRGPEFTSQKSEERLRVACLGDSHTFGEGVSESETWPAQLRLLLGDRAEVINAGVNAYDTLQEVLWYERFVEPFDPDLVVLAYFVNDVATRSASHNKDKDGWIALTHPRRSDWVRDVRNWSRAVDVLCDRIYNSRSLKARQDSWSSRYGEGDPGWSRAKSALLRLKERCESSGREFRLALMPYIFLEGEFFASHDSLQTVRDFCLEQGIAVFDGEPALLNELKRCSSAAELRVSKRNFHANGRAYRVFAESLHAWLLETLVLPESGSGDSTPR